jgi:hypothetical protein
MGTSPLSYSSSDSFRKKLIARNLVPYSVPGVYIPPAGATTYPVTLSNYSVENSNDLLISQNPFANNLYPLNEYGPDGGYQLNINYNGPLVTNNSNQGPYDPTDTVLDLVNEFYIDSAYIQNIYGPVGGFNDLIDVEDSPSQNRIYSPYWDSPSFVPSIYNPYEVLISNNPVGSDGSLSQDSYLAKIGITSLKESLQYRIDREIYIRTVGIVNLDALQDPFEASLVATGQEPFIYRNYRITVPANPITGAFDFATRLGSTYFPVSFIPGSYFQEPNKGFISQAISNIGNKLVGTLDSLLGTNIGGALETARQPSQLFLNNTGSGQRSVLFANLEMNLYGPQYEKGIGGYGTAIFNVANSLLNTNLTQVGQYYVGNRNAEPSAIESPSNEVPVDQFGRQVQTIVYGPSEMAQLYEGNEKILNFGLAGKSSSDGGGTDGQFVWVSPKYKPNAGFKVGPGGQTTTLDNEFNLVSNDYQRDESTNVSLKPGSILYDTQKLIDAADNVQGANRLKHVGNAINQVSKVFNDGYKELTKGSQVLRYLDQTTGQNAGVEYCRIFAKDTPYLTFADLQKTDGITTAGRKFGYSVLDNTYNLNIAPLKGVDSTNIRNGRVKKYMFSIENLAWRTSNRPGLTYNDLPDCEKGPNGGRVMWFPPYDLKFDDSSQPQFGSTNFLGRPEPIYTYQNTSRRGQISWKIIVDHPSVVNTIVQKQLANTSDERINSIMDSFFAGCVKYDIYELAKKFNQFTLAELQEIIQEIKRAPEETQTLITGIVREEAQNTPANAGGVTNQDESSTTPAPTFKKEDFQGIYVYFDNDIPSSGDINYQQTYDNYINNKSTYSTKKLSVSVNNVEYSKETVMPFFDTVTNSYQETTNMIGKIYTFLSENEGNKISMQLAGSASSPNEKAYNISLSQRRIDSVKKFLLEYPINGKSLKNFGPEGTGQFSFYGDEPGGEGTSYPKLNGTTNDIPCTFEPINTEGKKIVTYDSKVYSLPAMACRNVRFKNLNITYGKPKPTPTPTLPPPPPQPTPQPIPPLEVPTVDIRKRIRDGASKKVLRRLFSECDYFEMIKESNPMVFTTFKEKIKYFNPAFHSMTPEGLNARLTFLNQCVRPGDTIPVIGVDQNPKYNDALNTSFGTPPVLILRVGDFYNTKIIPDNLSFGYDPLIFDMNPEGIGVQPMIVNVTMSFKIIGGMGLAKPIEELQNALSFNYYANTEIYDERSSWTDESFKKFDIEIEESLKAKNIKPPTPQTPTTNGGGTPIGKIVTTVVTSGGTSGTLDYTDIMINLEKEVKNYLKNIINQSETIVKNYNLGVLSLTNYKRNYTEGSFIVHDSVENIEEGTNLYGKSDSYEERINSLFDQVITDIENNDNPIVLDMNNTAKFKESTIRNMKNNMINFIKNLKNDFSLKLSTTIQDISTQEQNLIGLISKINLVQQGYDGIISKQGTPTMYQLTFLDGSDVKLGENYAKVSDILNSFYDSLDTQWGLTSESNWNETDMTFQQKNDVISEPVINRFYTIILQTFANKNDKDNFINTIINQDLILTSEKNGEKDLKKKFTEIVDYNKNLYEKEYKEELNVFKTIKNDTVYKNWITESYYNEKIRQTSFVTNNSAEETYKNQLTYIYSTVNTNTDKTTYLGKVKLN